MRPEPNPRHLGELALPGALVGAFAGVFAGLIALIAGQPPAWVVLAAATLSVPVAAFGAGYSLMLARGVFRPGVFAPAALYWLIGFPLARLAHEAAHRILLTGEFAIPGGVPAFLLFQAMVSVGFAIGFLWAHERIMPRWLLRVRGHNPMADELLTDYLRLADRVAEAKRTKRA